ncbi:MAG TPA: glycosyltransferase family 4 protein [Bacilli bacterium]|nr:glycosyltransferase family 4 protein [Bacilli bacterium]
MHICCLSPGSLPLPPARCTSVEIYVAQLAREVSRAHPVTLFGKSSRVRRRKQGHLTTFTFPTRGGRAYLQQALQEIRRLRTPPSLLHVENRVAFVPLVKKAFPKTPVVLNLHSNVLIAQLSDRTVRACFRNMDALVVNSSFLRADLLRKYPALPAEKVHVIHPGVEIERYPARDSVAGKRLRREIRERLRVAEETKVLLFVGRFIPRKGILELVEAFREVQERFPETELWVVGGKPVQEENAYHQALVEASRGLPVRFLGFVKQPDLPKYYFGADLFVCPSQKPESFGLVNVEASACGLPVVASDAWGIREAVEDGVNGRLVERYAEPQALGQVLIELLSDPERMEQMGMQGRLLVEERFTWKKTAKEFEKLYRRTIK